MVGDESRLLVRNMGIDYVVYRGLDQVHDLISYLRLYELAGLEDIVWFDKND